MTIELAGARAIMPYFGVGLFVWSALISVTLLSLAAGYWIGGAVADRFPGLPRLALVVFSAGLWLLLIPLIRVPILEGMAHLGPRGGALVSALLLFAVPLVLLGMVTPLTLRLYTRSLAEVGRSGGFLYALSTVGSVLGTLGTGFLLIPNVEIPTIFALASSALVLLAIVAFLRTGMRRFAFLLLPWSLLVLVLFLPLTASRDGRILYSSQGYYGEVRIVDLEDRRYLLVDGTIQSGMEKVSRRSVFQVHRAMAELLTGTFPPGTGARGLFIGLAGGVLPGMLSRAGLRLDVVEIDPRMPALAARYFEYRPGPGRVIIADGRVFLRDTRERYDAVILDAFLAETVPFHLLTRESFGLIARRLTRDGVFMLNLTGFKEGEGSRVSRSIYRTLRQVFSTVQVFSTRPEGNFGNLLYLARRQAVSARSQYAVQLSFRDDGGLPITDDWNPLEAWWGLLGVVTRKAVWEALEGELLLE
ncbi:MAG: fused MFS/spermidine synthase [Candidatus Methylomirabilales bacterium]